MYSEIQLIRRKSDSESISQNDRQTFRSTDIACAILVWLRLKDLARYTGQTIYQIKHGLLSNYLVQQLKRPTVPMFIS